MFELEMISLNYTGPQRGRTEKNNDDDNNIIAKILGNNFVLSILQRLPYLAVYNVLPCTMRTHIFRPNFQGKKVLF